MTTRALNGPHTPRPDQADLDLLRKRIYQNVLCGRALAQDLAQQRRELAALRRQLRRYMPDQIDRIFRQAIDSAMAAERFHDRCSRNEPQRRRARTHAAVDNGVCGFSIG